MFLSKEAATMAGALGMVLLAISWHKRRNEGVSRLAQVGWILVGFYFFNDSRYYFEINDLVLMRRRNGVPELPFLFLLLIIF